MDWWKIVAATIGGAWVALILLVGWLQHRAGTDAIPTGALHTGRGMSGRDR